MRRTVTYSHVREHLAEIWNEIEDTRDVAVIQRRGHEDMALIPADELASLRETAYLLKRSSTIGSSFFRRGITTEL